MPEFPDDAPKKLSPLKKKLIAGGVGLVGLGIVGAVGHAIYEGHEQGQNAKGFRMELRNCFAHALSGACTLENGCRIETVGNDVLAMRIQTGDKVYVLGQYENNLFAGQGTTKNGLSEPFGVNVPVNVNKPGTFQMSLAGDDTMPYFDSTNSPVTTMNAIVPPTDNVYDLGKGAIKTCADLPKAE